MVTAVPRQMAKRYDLLRAIDESGYRKGYIAEQIGISASLFSKILNGHATADPDVAERLAMFLNVDATDVFCPAPTSS